jgi:RNA polymerase subunit RPABC4/transcription elongation factor Spt4
MEVFFLIGIAIAGTVGYIISQDAKRRGMDSTMWGIATFLLMFPFLLVYLVVRKPYITTEAVKSSSVNGMQDGPTGGITKLERDIPSSRPCPHCAEDIKQEAKICRYCQREVSLDPKYKELIEKLMVERDRLEEENRRRVEEERARAQAESKKPKGRCPNCSIVINLDSTECPKCGAMFQDPKGWKVDPI